MHNGGGKKVTDKIGRYAWKTANRKLCYWNGVSHEVHFGIKDVALMQCGNGLFVILWLGDWSEYTRSMIYLYIAQQDTWIHPKVYLLMSNN